MKDILKITFSLTIICVAAALILGAVFAKTDHARKENEEKIKEEVVEGLLGYGPGKTKPDNLRIYPVHRYVITSGNDTTLGYVVPVKDKKFSMIQIDLSGKPLKIFPVEADATKMAEASTRDDAVKSALPKENKAVYAETFYISNLGDKRQGYVVPGVTQGFKTFVSLMVSLDPDFTLTGIEITKSEEDPGLGDEIKQDYFKKQFAGKTADALKSLKVVKEPLPSDYVLALEPAKAKKAGTPAEEIKKIKEKHLKDDIYALTGATISSRAVTNGVKDVVRKFVYRIEILNEAIKNQNVQVVF